MQASTNAMTEAARFLDDVWVVVPAYNEAERLPATLSRLQPRFPRVVVVDDGSADATAQSAMNCPGIWVLRHAINLGQGAALQTGIDFALARGARFIATFDADGQHDVEDIPSLLEPLRQGRADVALGSRFLGSTIGMPWSRRLLLKAAVLFTRLFSRVRVTDAHNGLRAFSRRGAEQIRISLNGMAHASEIIDQIRRRRLRYCEVPVTIRYSEAVLNKGQSGWNSFRIVANLTLARIFR
jgi:glycosyltransferase involved in cell wall biosynthesis